MIREKESQNMNAKVFIQLEAHCSQFVFDDAQQ